MSDFPSVEVKLDILQAANVAVLIKSRMHDIQDLIDSGKAPGDTGIIFRSYARALESFNSVLSEGMRQNWVRD